MNLNLLSRPLLVITAALAFTLGCSMPKVRYYTLEFPHAARHATPAIPRHVTIQRFRAAQVLMDDRIVYRENVNEVNFYEYQRWASPPADLVTGYFLHCLKDGGTYAHVSSYSDGGQSDFTLQGRVHRFEEVDRGKEVFASVALEVELLETKTRASVWRGEAECTRPLESRDMTGVVRGIYQCLEETTMKLLADMAKQIANPKG